MCTHYKISIVCKRWLREKRGRRREGGEGGQRQAEEGGWNQSAREAETEEGGWGGRLREREEELEGAEASEAAVEGRKDARALELENQRCSTNAYVRK